MHAWNQHVGFPIWKCLDTLEPSKMRRRRHFEWSQGPLIFKVSRHFTAIGNAMAYPSILGCLDLHFAHWSKHLAFPLHSFFKTAHFLLRLDSGTCLPNFCELILGSFDPWIFASLHPWIFDSEYLDTSTLTRMPCYARLESTRWLSNLEVSRHFRAIENETT